jgi:cytochrome c oxidase subunit 2
MQPSLVLADLMMPKQASTVAAEVDSLYYFVFWLSLLFFVGIIAVMVYFAFKYKKRGDDDKTSPVHHSTKLEIWWSAIPTALLMVIFVWGFNAWMDMQVVPDNAMELRVTARQWGWQFDYPSEGIVNNKLVVPVNTPIKLTMTSSDVLHSLFVPAFRVKKDVIPGRYSVLWFEATEVGVYDLYCTEYCGKDHSKMITHVEVMTQEKYQEWIDTGGLGEAAKDMPMSEIGKIFFNRYGCNQCHSVDGTANTGPSLLGVYGTDEECSDGTTVKVDDDYLRESILMPAAKVVKGFQPRMPSFKGKIKEKQLTAIIEYIKSIGK